MPDTVDGYICQKLQPQKWKNDKCSVSYHKKKWGSLLGLHQKKLQSFLEYCENNLETSVETSEDIITISIPNLLKIRDNYTSNLQVTCKQEVEVEVDKEVDKEKKNQNLQKIVPKTELVASQPDYIFPLFLFFKLTLGIVRIILIPSR